MKKTLSTLVLSLVFSFALLAGTTIYVAPYGNDQSGNGSIQAPYKTPTKAFGLVNPGDTVILRDGTYQNKFGWRIERSGTASAPITITTKPGERAVMQASESLGGWFSLGNGIYQTQASHHALPMVFVDGQPFQRVLTGFFESGSNCTDFATPISKAYEMLEKPGQFIAERVEGGDPYSVLDDTYNIYLKVDGSLAGSDVQVSHAPYVLGFGRYANPTLRKANYIDVDGLEFENSANYGLSIYSDHINVTNSLVRNTLLDGIKGYPSFYNMDQTSQVLPPASHVLIENCEITQFGRAAIAITGGQFWDVIGSEIHHGLSLVSTDDFNLNQAVTVSMAAKNVVVENNSIHDMLVKYGAVTLGGSSYFPGIANPTSCPDFDAEDVLFEDNVFYNLSWHPVRSAGKANAIVLYSGAKNAWFFNNDVYNSNAQNFIEVTKRYSSHPVEGSCANQASQDIFLMNNNFYDATWEGAFIASYQPGLLQDINNCVNCTSNPGAPTAGNAASGPRAIIKPLAGLSEKTCAIPGGKIMQLTAQTATLVVLSAEESVNHTSQPLSVSWNLVRGTSLAALQDNGDGTAQLASLTPGTAWVTLTTTAADGSSNNETLLLHFQRPNGSR